ncbi:MAG: 3-oxoacyl-[acyl-carrier-protein] reductase [Desulfovibrionaceae bacterium]|nr:3-oxoacyl-[acyl-carrier-protein] reductase [Desulfovibrionaceae bacterium]MDD4951054.1 3-oxoacyl-[acyl-carrier-protein] reductase [Desulfovibrionaceae bacterium]
MSTTERAALVTGGSRGIGRAVCRALARDGFLVLLTYVSRPEQAEEVCREIAAAGGRARAFRLDSADRGAVAAFFKDQIKDQVQLEVLVNNAGVTRDGLIMRMKDEDWDLVLRVNLGGAFACLREAARIMAKQRRGRIINISSVVGQMGNAGQANYVSAKAGLIGLTKSAARELAARGVTVNAVAPGFIQTDMTAALPEKIRDQMLETIPLGRPGTPEDVAEAVCFLAGDRAGYITGQVLAVNGGMYM